MLSFRLDITQLSQTRLRRIRAWLVVAIVGVMAMQSVIGLLLVTSLDYPYLLRQQTRQTERQLQTFRQKVHKQLANMLDFGQEPTQKKENRPAASGAFNLFADALIITLPPCRQYDVIPSQGVGYLLLHGSEFPQKIPHPPRFA
ncbi:hypothetical protein [Arsenicibacter rosenii]|uniref:Uncharacterized protein n=1 Tax=Arsenicibacter rosenii TaxID=1750698 RepID=A0A1S2VLL2_9BACT|nr:hypothetical protein [Arsenicibacter rosenii]OIN59086.1 hypothetical protein BLX24_12845 [Arsenicibacter rosenii]